MLCCHPERCSCKRPGVFSTNCRSLTHMGLTLVELVIALFLASLLMVGLLGVLKGVERQRQIVERIPDDLWRGRVQEILERDLLAAEKIGWSVDRLVLEGTLPTYEPGLASSHRNVEYGIAGLHGAHPVLYRRDRGELQWIALGPRRILAERIDRAGIPQPLPAQPGPLPQRLRVWIWVDLESPPVLQFDIMP